MALRSQMHDHVGGEFSDDAMHCLNIDDVSSRDERNPLIPKAMRRLAQAVNSIMTQVAPFKDKATTEAEVASLELLNEDAQQILEAAKKLPPEPEKKGKTKN